MVNAHGAIRAQRQWDSQGDLLGAIQGETLVELHLKRACLWAQIGLSQITGYTCRRLRGAFSDPGSIPGASTRQPRPFGASADSHLFV